MVVMFVPRVFFEIWSSCLFFGPTYSPWLNKTDGGPDQLSQPRRLLFSTLTAVLHKGGGCGGGGGAVAVAMVVIVVVVVIFVIASSSKR